MVVSIINANDQGHSVSLIQRSLCSSQTKTIKILRWVKSITIFWYILLQSIYIMRVKQFQLPNAVGSIMVPGVLTHCGLFPELESHHQMQFSVIHRTCLFFRRCLTPLQRIQLVYWQWKCNFTLSSTQKLKHYLMKSNIIHSRGIFQCLWVFIHFFLIHRCRAFCIIMTYPF